MKKIAVVILNWNGAKLLDQFLPSVVAFSNEATIYVADNASTDTSIEILKSQFPSIKIIQNSCNYGFAMGYNEALKYVDEEYYALVNSDIEVTENWLSPIIELFDSQAKVAIIQPKILDYKKKSHFEYAGAAGGFMDKYGYPFCRGRIFDTVEEDLKQYDDEIEIFWASGACFFIRKEVYHQLNGFDATFFAHQEEIDLCWRAFNAGFTTKYNPKSVVYHVGGATLKEENPMKTYLNFRNSLFMLTKNLPKKDLFPILFTRLFFDGLAGIQFIVKGRFKHCLAIIHAHFALYKWLKTYYKQRNNVQKTNYFKARNIVISYFFNNTKKFDQLF